jgi:hypothetical protein
MVSFPVAVKSKEVPTEMVMPLCAAKYLGKLGVRKHHSFLWDNEKISRSVAIG